MRIYQTFIKKNLLRKLPFYMNILFLGNTKDFKTTNDDKNTKAKKNAKVVIIHVLGLGNFIEKISP